MIVRPTGAGASSSGAESGTLGGGTAAISLPRSGPAGVVTSRRTCGSRRPSGSGRRTSGAGSGGRAGPGSPGGVTSPPAGGGTASAAIAPMSSAACAGASAAGPTAASTGSSGAGASREASRSPIPSPATKIPPITRGETHIGRRRGSGQRPRGSRSSDSSGGRSTTASGLTRAG